MQYIYEYHDVEASDRLENLAQEKLKGLQVKFSDVHRADIFFKTENTTSDETGMICNIRLSLPGPRLFSEASHSNFETSIMECVSELERQLKKRKEKLKEY